ncbi:hypothetical protein BU15DRAFT_87105 [Melanogaster broomeanus]|nr:hypothetical protein BU15DRAFT_87105 [Melanogaster broomeanus]
MTGNHVAHPLLLGLANIWMNTQSKLSSNAFSLLALLPVPKFIHCKKCMHNVLEDRLIHECLDVILQPLKIVAQLGIMMSDPLPITPEARMLACVRDKTSPLTTATYLQTGHLTLSQLAKLRADPLLLEGYFNACQRYQLNGVVDPFWRDWPLACPSSFLTPEMLHHWHKQCWDHDLRCAIHVLTPAEIDFHMSVLQPISGYRHFKEGISSIKQVTGTEHHHIQRYFIAVIAGAAPQNFVVALHSLMDFCYLGQASLVFKSQVVGLKKDW